MEKGTRVNVDVNVTKIVKYVCLAGAAIVFAIFSHKSYTAFLADRKPYTTNN